jgi:DNA ligase (NAD+)
MTVEEQKIWALKEANLAYRNGNPIISDKMYDSEYDKLYALYPDNDFFTQVGFKVVDKDRERKLEIPMASMNKVKGMDELADWFRLKGIKDNEILVLTPKFDGLSLAVNEKANRATTRGDGISGQNSDIHYNLIKNHLGYSEQHHYMTNFFEHTYGEVMMSKNTFITKYSADFANPRNLVAGLINNKLATAHLEDCEYIKYGGIVNDEFKSKVKFKHNILDGLNAGQQTKVKYKLVTLADLSEPFFVSLFKEWSEFYEIDGIIIEVDSLAIQDSLGRERSSDNPCWARAYKSPAFEQSAETEVIGITWNISKQGYLKPILHVNPVKLDGVTVSNVTGNNARYVKDNGIGVGAIVKIVRSGMVIPKVVGIIKSVPFVMPNVQNIGWNDNGVELITLSETKEQLFKQLVSFFEILEVENAGEGVFKQLWEAGYTTIKQVLELKPRDMEGLDGFGKRKSEIVYGAIQSRTKDVELSKLMHGSGIFNGLGSKKLVLLEHFKTKPTVDDILQIEGFADRSAQIFIDGYDTFYNDFLPNLPLTVKATDILVATSNELAGKNFVFTGVRSDAAELKIKEMGGKISSSVSKTTSYLVMKTVGSGSAKETKAEGLGVKIVTLEQLNTILGI